MHNRVLLFVNPISGKGKSRAIAVALARRAAEIGVVAVTLEPESAISVTDDLQNTLGKSDFDAIVAVGGDGLVHNAIQVIATTSTALYVVPAGTGNDFARSNELLATDAAQILDRIYGKNASLVDAGRIRTKSGDRWFGQILSTGFDDQVNQRANRNRLINGKMKYNVATIFELPKFKTINYEIEADGVSRKFSAMLVAVANGSSYGGGMKLSPMADRSDGFLDVMILHPVSKIELLKVFPKVYSGSHINHPAVEFIRVKKIKITANTIAYADGERIGNLPIEIELVPSALRTWIAE